MEFDLPPDLAMLRDGIRRFVDEQLIPVEMSSDAGGNADGSFAAIRDQAQQMGLWHLDVPEDLGGMGLGLLGTSVIEEEIARTRAFPTRIHELFGPFVAPVLYAASGEQRARFLQPVLDGHLSVRGAAADLDTEVDPARLGVTAARQGDAYVVDGVQEHVSSAPPPDYLVVFARTGEGVTCLLIGVADTGVTLSPAGDTLQGDQIWRVRLDGVATPVSNRLGAEGAAAELARRWVITERIRRFGARSVGIATRALEMTAAYSRRRVTFGKPLASRHAIRVMLADSMTEIRMARLLVHEAAQRFDDGSDVRDLSTMVKIGCTEMAGRVIDRAMQIHGGIGLTTELPLEHWFREVRGTRTDGGVNEVLRGRLADTLVGTP